MELCIFRCVASIVATHFFISKEKNKMDYLDLYAKLFNGITDTIENLQKLQIQVEEDYLKMSDENENKVIKFNIVKGKNVILEDTAKEEK